MIDFLLGAFPYSDAYELEEGYRAEYPESRYAAILRLDTRLQLWKNGELYTDLSKGRLGEALGQTLLEI